MFKNKKADIFEWLIIFPFFLMGLLGLMLVEANRQESLAEDIACQELGMEKSVVLNQEVCIEPNGKAHFAKFNCEGF